MAIEFFDKIAASVSKTAKEVSDSAKVLADKNRVRKDIAALENELRSRFRDIGEQFFNENADAPAEGYAELFAAVTELKANLAAKQKELEALDGTVSCTGCGKPLAKGVKFCPYCGAVAPEPPAAPETEAPVQTVCGVCGASLAADAMFCAACGNPVTAAPAAPAAAVPLVCSNCGEPLQPDALFCAGCGTKAPGVE